MDISGMITTDIMKKADRHTEERLLYFGAKDTLTSSKIALPVIMLFELFMMGNWFVDVNQPNSIASNGYMVGYVFLFAVSAITFLYVLYADKHLTTMYRSIILVQDIYCAFFIIWALSFTFIGGVLRGNFSVIIYMTVLTIIPVFSYVSPVFSVVAESVASIAVIFIASICEEHFRSFIINFAVFATISTVATISLYLTRRKSYLRQIELEQLASENLKMAYVDDLTSLKNRRSYMDDIELIANDATGNARKNLIIMSADVNGLKKTNDTMGHEAGDELLRGTAVVLSKTFSPYGTVYRMGGDEFSGILKMTDEDLATAKIALEHNLNEWHGKYIGRISLSSGFAAADHMPEASLKDLEITADDEMYANKKAYYQNSQHNRRAADR